jgi:TM2 domain-containing membrane protein YozV
MTMGDDQEQYRGQEPPPRSLERFQENVPVRPVIQPHSAELAVVASFFIPGLGSMLNKKAGKGVLILACYIVAWISTIVLVGFILAPAVWIWGMVSAHGDAHRWNRAHGIIS